MPGAVRVAIELAVFRVRVARKKRAPHPRVWQTPAFSSLREPWGLCALRGARPPEYPNGRPRPVRLG